MDFCTTDELIKKNLVESLASQLAGENKEVFEKIKTHLEKAITIQTTRVK